MEKNVYIGKYPAWICPTCNSGVLCGGKKDIIIHECVDSDKNRADHDWEPEWVYGWFTGSLKCNSSRCGEIAFVTGTMNLIEDHEYDEQSQRYNFVYVESLEPNLFIPSLNIFTPHSDIPEQIVKMIKDSFRFFWMDPASCGNKIRTIIEVLMDHQNIPKTYLLKKKRI